MSAMESESESVPLLDAEIVDNELLTQDSVVALRDAVDDALRLADTVQEPDGRARAQAQLLSLLQEHVEHVTAARDAALTELFLTQPGASNRELGRQLHLSHQRVNQLRQVLRAGGRPPRR